MTPFILGLAALNLGHCLPVQTAPKAAPAAVVRHDDEQRITALAAAAYIAGCAYDEALRMDDPAKTLDSMAAELPEVMPKVCETLGAAPDAAAVIVSAVADRVRAYIAVEQARTTWHPGYRYVLDVLVDGLKKGGNPASVRADVRRLTKTLAAHKDCA
jgi:hypothetical protein